MQQRVEQAWGEGTVIKEISPVQVSLRLARGEVGRPNDPTTLTRNLVAYDVRATSPTGTSEDGSLVLRFDGQCFRASTFNPLFPWEGSTGVDTPRVTAKQALRLAREFRTSNPESMPPSAPVIALFLLRQTSAPPDFGRLRWQAYYELSSGTVQLLSIYMDGTVVRNL